jgi:nucleoside 2-deoxyribosyltransferase
MKVYVSTRYKGSESRHEVERLTKAVRGAGLKDFSFVRDVEKYKHVFDDPKKLWARTKDEIGACDALLIDVSDHPSGSRLVEAGMAYALGKTVIVVKHHDATHKAVFDGISSVVITYSDDMDLMKQLKRFDKDHAFNTTDKSMLLAILLCIGVGLSYVASLFWIPLSAAVALSYWLIIRHLFATVRMYDRIVVYIPLTAIWLGGYAWLTSVDITVALAWGIIFWIVVLPLLQRTKMSV